MPKHDCLEHWGRSAEALAGLLAAQTAAAREEVKGGIGRRPRKPYEGWVHRVKTRADYDRIVHLYFEMCLAIKQPTDIPTHWGRTEVRGRQGPRIDASAMGRLATRILKGLEADGMEKRPRKAVPVHTEKEVPRYGTPNWLEKPPEDGNFDAIRLARRLVCELREAFAR